MNLDQMNQTTGVEVRMLFVLKLCVTFSPPRDIIPHTQQVGGETLKKYCYYYKKRIAFDRYLDQMNTECSACIGHCVQHNLGLLFDAGIKDTVEQADF